MLEMNFDLARYIAFRKGMVEQRAKDGSAYGFVGERKVRRALVNARPVTMAMEGTARRWKSSARATLLKDATRVGDQHPQVLTAATEAAHALGMERPPLYVVDKLPLGTQTLGTAEDAVVLLSQDYLARLTEEELRAAIGRELGHIQNAHLLYGTALYYLRHDAVFFVRWIVKPAVLALQAWSRRADVTCDRAALICSRSVTVTVGAILKAATTEEIDAESFVDTARAGTGRYQDFCKSHPRITTRTKALLIFAESRFFKKLLGEDDADADGADAVDSKVTELLGVFA